MARTGDDGPNGISTFIIPKDTDGLSFGKLEEKMASIMRVRARYIVDTSNNLNKHRLANAFLTRNSGPFVFEDRRNIE